MCPTMFNRDGGTKVRTFVACALALSLWLSRCTFAIESDGASRSGVPLDIGELIHAKKIVVVKGWSREELRDVVVSFVNVHKQMAADVSRLSVEEITPRTFWLLLPKDIDQKAFLLLVKYVSHPEGLSSHHIVAVGLSEIAGSVSAIEDFYAAFYVPVTKRNADVVYTYTTRGGSYRYCVVSDSWEMLPDPHLSPRVRDILRRSTLFDLEDSHE